MTTLDAPADLAIWLNEETRERFDELSYGQKRRYVRSIVDARTPEIRERRVALAVRMLQERRDADAA